MNPGLLTFALAPAVPGVVSIALGVGIFTVLVRDAITPEEAAVRLFAAGFVLLGAFFLRQARSPFSAARGHKLGNGPGPAAPSHTQSLLWAVIDTVVVFSLVIPFHLWWRAPWPTFGNVVRGLDVLALLVAFRLVVALWRWARRRRTATPPAAPLTSRMREKRLRRWGFALMVSGVLTGLMAWAALPLAVANWRAWSKLAVIEGVVTRQHSYQFRGRDGGAPSVMAAVLVEYTIGGQSFESFQPMDPASPLFRKGSRVSIRVDPSNPKVARSASAYDTFLITFVLLLLMMFSFGIAAISASRIAALRAF